MYPLPIIKSIKKINNTEKTLINYLINGKNIFKFTKNENNGKKYFILDEEFFEGFKTIGLDLKNLVKNNPIKIEEDLKFLFEKLNKDKIKEINSYEEEFIHHKIFKLIKELTGITLKLNMLEVDLNKLEQYPKKLDSLLKNLSLFYNINKNIFEKNFKTYGLDNNLLLDISYLKTKEAKKIKKDMIEQTKEIIRLNKLKEDLTVEILNKKDLTNLKMLNEIYLYFKNISSIVYRYGTISQNADLSEITLYMNLKKLNKIFFEGNYRFDDSSNLVLKINHNELLNIITDIEHFKIIHKEKIWGNKFSDLFKQNNIEKIKRKIRKLTDIELHNKDIKRVLNNKENIKNYPVLKAYNKSLTEILKKYKNEVYTNLNKFEIVTQKINNTTNKSITFEYN